MAKLETFSKVGYMCRCETLQAADLTYQVLVFLERLFMAGLKLYGEDHRDVWENPEDFFVRMLRHEGQLG